MAHGASPAYGSPGYQYKESDYLSSPPPAIEEVPDKIDWGGVALRVGGVLFDVALFAGGVAGVTYGVMENSFPIAFAGGAAICVVVLFGAPGTRAGRALAESRSPQE